MSKTLYLIRGLPGSGKSTLARVLVSHNSQHWEADMFFINGNGDYKFNPKLLPKAHEWCQKQVERVMKCGLDVAVSNTFTRLEELFPYRIMAEHYGYDVQIIECHGEFGSIHDVPERTIRRMRERWQPTPVDGWVAK